MGTAQSQHSHSTYTAHTWHNHAACHCTHKHGKVHRVRCSAKSRRADRDKSLVGPIVAVLEVPDLETRIGHNIGLEAPLIMPTSMGAKWSVAHGAWGVMWT